MPRSAKALAKQMEAMWDAANAEGRDLTAAERSQMEELVEATKSMHGIEQQMRELGGDAPSFVTRTDPNWSSTAGGPGDVRLPVPPLGYPRAQTRGRVAWT